MNRLYVPTDIEQIVDRLGPDAGAFDGASILLCGGHGFLGRHFTAVFAELNRRVLKAPCRLIVMDNNATGGPAVAAPADAGYEFIAHDITQPVTLPLPIEYIIHAAGIASPAYYQRFPLETLEVATLGTKHLLLLARQQPRLKGFLFFSSSEIYGDPDERHIPTAETYRGNVSCVGPRACYDESKRLGETLCVLFHERHGVPATIVRPFNIYGPGMQERDYRVLPNFASRIVAGQPIHVYGHGRQTRTFCYVTDAVTGFLKALLAGHRGEPYNIGNPTPEISMFELAKTLERVLGRSLDIRLASYPDSYPQDEPQRRCPDISKAAAHLGYAPAVPLEEGLKRFMVWAAANHAGA